MIALALLVAVWPAYVWTAWRTRRAAGRRALAALWLGASALYGYLRYREVCGGGTSCDKVWLNPWFLNGNPHYFIHYVPGYTLVGLVAFGVASVVVDRRAADAGAWLSPRTMALGTLASLAGAVAASLAADALWLNAV
ncbi:hypothetical protein [Longimicrobium sp.]|uniref:hypothetical protein n=1 Tax=Longimicrobium sp. TaxID=2029185 RepID=UPI002E3657BF|nr:hypothetical protein [Longimicrobium sp.]HEX6040105.1 hypothetical protein [Longimicrobium sp.]